MPILRREPIAPTSCIVTETMIIPTEIPSRNREPVALALDIGGSATKVGLVSSAGEILDLEETPTDVQTIGLEDFLGKVLEMLDEMLRGADGPLAGIGGTFLGWIDEARTGPYLCMNAPALHGLNLRRILEERYSLPVHLIDDANAHAIAEYRLGSGHGCRRFMSLAMGTGLGIGVLIDGEPLDFTSGCIGDAGHIILRPDGPTCSSGCRGCGEALIGVAGIELLAREKYGLVKSAHEIIQAAREQSDPQAIATVREIGLYTGELLASISHIFLPDQIALTGGTATAGHVLLNAVRTKFDELVGEYHRRFARASKGYYSEVNIVLGELRGETGVIGAALGVFDQVRNRPRH